MAYNPKDKNPSGVVLFGNNGSDQVFESVTGFVYDTGNTRLGINTSSPQYTLDVSGTGTFHTIRFADGTEMITSGGGGGGTTYTAGSGLTLDGTEFNVFGGSGNFQYIELKSSTQDPQIYFLGSGSNDTPITLNILSSYQSASSSGSALVFDGTEGQLFAITDNLSSGVIFSVADIAGLPLIEADASGDVQLIEFGRYVGVGTGTPQYQLDVFGTGRFSEGIMFGDGTTQTTAAGAGGMTSWDLSVTGDSTTISDGETVTFTGQGSITTTRNANTVIISGAAAGGGTPGGSDTQVQFNDGGSFGGDSNFTWDKSSDKLTISVNHINDALLLTSTEGSSDASPVLTLKRDSSTPADGDYLGQLKFKGESDTSVERVYAKITAKTLDVSNGTEDGLIEYMVREAGSNKIMSRFRGDSIRVLNGANFIAEGDGKVGVGDTSPTYQVDVVGTGNFTGGVRFPDGNVQVVAYTGGAGGGTPGGSVNQIQINDGAGGFTAAGSSDQFTFSNNVIELGRSSDNSGSDVRNTWFSNNFCIGGNNFSSSTDTDADFNTAVGINALGAMTFPDANTAVGYYSMYQNTLGNHNTAVGYLSLQGLVGNGAGVAGDYNVAIGSSACGALQGASSNTASYNTAVGYQSQNSNQVHNNVTTLGYRAGYNVQSYNIYIGDDCPYGTTAANGSGNLIIRSVGGYGNLSQFRGEGNNELCIGNIYAGNQSTQRACIGDINTIGDSPDAALHIQPINSSDIVLKVQGAAAQSANLQEWRNSSDTELASVGPSGRLYYQSSYSPISNEGTASSFTFDLDTSNVFSGTLSAASTLTTSNGDVGQRFLVRLKQGSGGSKTISSWFNGRVSWPGGSAPTLSSTEGHVDLFGFLVTHGTAPTLYYDGFTIATGIQ